MKCRWESHCNVDKLSELLVQHGLDFAPLPFLLLDILQEQHFCGICLENAGRTVNRTHVWRHSNSWVKYMFGRYVCYWYNEDTVKPSSKPVLELIIKCIFLKNNLVSKSVFSPAHAFYWSKHLRNFEVLACRLRLFTSEHVLKCLGKAALLNVLLPLFLLASGYLTVPVNQNLLIKILH